MKAKTCFVAMFDIIGFKALRAELGTDGLYKKFKGLVQPVIAHASAGAGEVQEVNGQRAFVPKKSEVSINHKIISDSVILYTDTVDIFSFLKIVRASRELLKAGFGISVPFRGAIGYGDLIDDPLGTYIGSAIEDAYIGESSQVWSGCMFTENCEKFLKENKFVEKHQMAMRVFAEQTTDLTKRDEILKTSREIVSYEVPCQRNPKSGPIEYYSETRYALDWTYKVFEGAAQTAIKDSDDPHAQHIKENTVAFEQWARSRP